MNGWRPQQPRVTVVSASRVTTHEAGREMQGFVENKPCYVVWQTYVALYLAHRGVW